MDFQARRLTLCNLEADIKLKSYYQSPKLGQFIFKNSTDTYKFCLFCARMYIKFCSGRVSLCSIGYDPIAFIRYDVKLALM